MKPTIGRIVHYVNLGDIDGKYPPEIQAALITGVYRDMTGNDVNEPANTIDSKPNSMWVDLKIFYRTGFFDMKEVPYSESYGRGHWSWPPIASAQESGKD
jgi:hypothetical protein